MTESKSSSFHMQNERKVALKKKGKNYGKHTSINGFFFFFRFQKKSRKKKEEKMDHRMFFFIFVKSKT